MLLEKSENPNKKMIRKFLPKGTTDLKTFKNQISEDIKPLHVYIHICNKCIKYNNFIKHSTLYLTHGLNILHTAQPSHSKSISKFSMTTALSDVKHRCA